MPDVLLVLGVLGYVVGQLLGEPIRVGQGPFPRLDERDGCLRGRLRPAGPWWWAALAGSRLARTCFPFAPAEHPRRRGARFVDTPH